jgi:uncharacterized membrane protein YgaE (UPF0421/DUF939 family)
LPDGRRELKLATAAIVGACLAFAVGIFATLVRLDRDRAFYPTVAIVIASLYSLFAAIGGSTRALVVESVVGVGFIALAVFGFRTSLWLVAAALALHGVFDLVHGSFISNPGVPHWWPAFCLTYDVAAAGYLALLIISRRTRSAA